MKPTPTEVITPGEIVNPLSSGKGTYSGGWTSTCKTSNLDGKDADKERIMSRRASLQDFQNRQGCLRIMDGLITLSMKRTKIYVCSDFELQVKLPVENSTEIFFTGCKFYRSV